MIGEKCMTKRSLLLVLGIIILVFFFLRLTNLTLLPIFADEAIYVRWAQIMRAEPTLRFLPLSDGKQPFFMWILMFLLPLFSDPLLGGRLISVMAGFGSLVGIFLISRLLFKNRKTALLAALFYAVVPFFVFFDRMALVDSLLAMFGIWFFLLSVLLVNNLRLDLAMIAGMVLGGGLITKSPALFFALLLPSTLVLASWVDLKKPKKTMRQLIKLVGLWLVIYFFGFAIYSLLRLGPGFEMIGLRSKDYVFPLSWLLSHPFDSLKPHLAYYAEWLPNLFTWPILFLSLVGLVIVDRKKRRPVLFLFLVAFLPLLAQAAVAKVFTPRYLLFACWPLLILAALGLGRLRLTKNKLVCLMAIIGVMVLPLFYDYQLLTDPQKAPLPRRMRSGYLEEWCSGYGIKEVVEFINQRLSLGQRNIVVGTEGYFGTLPNGLEIYFDKERKVLILGVGVPINQVPDSLKEASRDNEVYLVVNRSRMLVKNDSQLILLKSFPKAEGPSGQDALLLYQLKNEE